MTGQEKETEEKRNNKKIQKNKYSKNQNKNTFLKEKRRTIP